MATREQIYIALFNKAAAAAAFGLTSRKLRLWSEVRAADMPALFMSELNEGYKLNGSGIPPSKEFSVELYLYAPVERVPVGAAPVSPLNDILDAIEAALGPSLATGRQDLGGLVYNAYIENSITKDDGSLGEIAVAIIPITIRVTK